jgi:hypothetical protein
MGLWRGVCLLCHKCTLICLVLKTCLKFSLYLVLNEHFQYNDLEALGCLPYPVVWPSTWSRNHLRKIMSNTVISKLRGVCRTQSCDPPYSLEIIWGLKMSKLLNLISYSLACLLTCINWVLSCICERLVKHASRIIVALFEMMFGEFIYAYFGWDRSLYACGDLLNLLIHFISYLSSWLLACYLLVVSLGGLTLVFTSLGIMIEYSCLNTFLYTCEAP